MATQLSRELLRLFAQGELSGVQVQKLAKAAWDDGWGRTDRLAERLMQAGSCGTWTGHIAKQIIQAAEQVGMVCNSSSPYHVKLPDDAMGSVYLPHELFSDMVKDTNLEQWCLTPEQLQATRGLGPLLQRWASHRDVQFAGDLGSVAILGLHSDAVAYTASQRAGGQRGILVASLNVVSGRTVEHRAARQPLFVISKGRLCSCGCGGFCTIQVFMRVFAWSMRAMLAGRAPDCRHDGSPWSAWDRMQRMTPGEVVPTAALLQVRGDWEGLCTCFRLRSFKSDNFCWMCQATQITTGELDYRNFRHDAPHRGTLVSHEQYMMSCAADNVEPSHLFKCPGTLLEHLTVDSMHSGDLGCFQDALGSLFWLHITNKSWFRSSKVGLASLNDDLKAYYSANHDQGLSSIYPLVMSQVTAKVPGYPCLKSKAAQCRHLADFGLSLAQRHRYGGLGRGAFRFRESSRMYANTDEHLDLLERLFQGLVQYHRACSAVPFPEDQCRQGMYDFLGALSGLNRLWRHGLPADHSEKGLPFHLRPKGHGLQHLVADKLFLFGSPSAFWCYRDEDYIGAVKRIAQASKHPWTIEKRVMEKLRILTKLSVRL